MYRIQLLLMVLLLLGWGCKSPRSSGSKSSSKIESAKPQPPIQPAVDPMRSKLRTKDEAIADGLRYLSNVNSTWDLAYLYSYLQPKFQWPNLPFQDKIDALQDSLEKVGDTPSLRILDQMILFNRLIDPNFLLPNGKLQTAEEEDAFTVVALYCDQLKPDSATFFPILRREMAAGDYRLTHALLAYVWLAEQRCFSTDEMLGLRAELIRLNYLLVAKFPDWIDLKIESAALLQASGETLPTDWIAELIREQQLDGGWRKDIHQSHSEGHATMLALWLLAGSK